MHTSRYVGSVLLVMSGLLLFSGLPVYGFTVGKVPAKFEGGGDITLHDCSDKCGTGIFKSADCDPNKCTACEWPSAQFEATVSPSKSMTMIVSHVCTAPDTCYVADPKSSGPLACVETLTGTYDPFSEKFDLTGGYGPRGYYTCFGDGKVGDSEIRVDGISCKTKKGESVFDVGVSRLRRLPDPEELEDSGARFSGLTGQVETRPDADEDAWKLAGLETVLHVRDHIRTQEDSSAIIGFPDMSTFVLKAESEVVVTPKTGNVSNLRMLAGNIYANVKKMLKDGSMEVEMNQAVAGIKGTTFVASETAAGSQLKVIEGHVVFTAKKTGEKTDVFAGDAAVVDGAGTITKSKFDVMEEEKAWQAVKTPASSPSRKVIFIAIALGVIALVAFWVVKRRKQ